MRFLIDFIPILETVGMLLPFKAYPSESLFSRWLGIVLLLIIIGISNVQECFSPWVFEGTFIFLLTYLAIHLGLRNSKKGAKG